MLGTDDIRRRVDSFDRWHYQFDLNGVTTPIWDPRCVNRHAQRKRYFLDPVVELFGGSLRGKRVLDLASNAGFWSLAAIEAGCDFVRGIEGRLSHVEQAELVFDVNGVDPGRYEFVHGDVFGVEWGTGFDIVLCLGLLYHVNRPVELFDAIARANTDLLVVDTAIVHGGEPAFAMHRDDAADPRSAIRTSWVLFPTAAAVVELARSAGYHGVILRPEFDDYTAADDFRDGLRRAFVCAKKTDLALLADRAEAAFASAASP